MDFEPRYKCRNTSDCPWGQYCSRTAGWKCLTKVPIGSACAQNEACDQYSGCHDGICRKRCGGHRLCPEGHECTEGESGTVCLPISIASGVRKDYIEPQEPVQTGINTRPLVVGAVILFVLIILAVGIAIVRNKKKGLVVINSSSDSMVNTGLPSQPPSPDTFPTPLFAKATIENIGPSAEPPSYREAVLSTIVEHSA